MFVQIFNFFVNDSIRTPYWNLVTKLTAIDGAEYDQFGTAVSTDGTYLAVGAPYHGTGSSAQSGQVYIYRNGVWASNQAAILRPPNPTISDFFGISLVVFGYAAIHVQVDCATYLAVSTATVTSCGRHSPTQSTYKLCFCSGSAVGAAAARWVSLPGVFYVSLKFYNAFNFFLCSFAWGLLCV